MIAFSAKYYDGVVSDSVEVTVELDDANTLHVIGLPQPVAHPLGSVRVAPRLGNTQRKVTLPDGATCESLDHVAMDELLRHAGRGKGGTFVHKLESTWRAALFATAALVVLVAIGVVWGIPLAARQVAQAIPPSLAYDLGRGTLAMLDRTMLKPTQLPAERQAELTSGFEIMADEYPDLPLELNFRRGVGPNAFALPDGSVIVSDELVALAKDDKEIYSVLMHEIGHVHHRHALRMALESSTMVILVSTYLGDVTQLSTLSSTMPGIIAQSHYSREHETEADTFALAYLDRAHIPRKHYASILRSLQASVGKDPEQGMQYLASHPPTAERIHRFEQ
jgi:Zn-dependent protease with chaperone function